MQSLLYVFFALHFLCQHGVALALPHPSTPVPQSRVCGTEDPSEDLLSSHRALYQQQQSGSNISNGNANRLMRRQNMTNLKVDIYFHIVSTLDDEATVTRQMIQDQDPILSHPRKNLESPTSPHRNQTNQNPQRPQLSILTQSYAPQNIDFALRNITRTINDTWATDGDDTNMKVTLRQGTYNALNIYFQTQLANSILGLTTLPSSILPQTPSTEYATDGCNILAGTMPGGAIGGYNMGMTTVHEVGHWFGLLHTFQGDDCDGDGDYIADTPSEALATEGCPTLPPKNSCTDRLGVDPIHNYMDYSWDAW
ncbi:MAG: hypothetical protein M1827_002135 [Pycnora praestabilis]|nr:MAG: hypothetical protein M1827_002135 [Pycnora praestabilis]